MLECAGSVRAAGREAAERLLAAEPPPTAILATSDVLALGVLDAAARAGVAVPGELSVVGFDDVPAAADAGLTTVRQDHHAKGRLAGELLLAALRDEQAARARRCWPTSWSCAAAPGRRGEERVKSRRSVLELKRFKAFVEERGSEIGAWRGEVPRDS